MTEQVKQAFESSLGLYINVVTQLHFGEGLTQEQWIRLYNREGLTESEKELVQLWDNLSNNPSDPLNLIHNYLYALIETGNLARLSTDLQDIDPEQVQTLLNLIDRWNNN
jgi:hypothetical protein